MLEKQICRRCAAHSHRGLNKSFSVQGSKPHYAPDRPFRLEHILLDVNVDPKKKTLSGEATQSLLVVAPNQTQVKLDQIGLEIHGATVDGKKAEFEKDDQSVTIQLPKAPKPGSKLELAVKYSLENPRRGIYFTGPDADYPEKPWQVWTQGQDEDSRYWFPGFDYPNQKATSEIIATVPKGFTAVANGKLLSRDEKGGSTRFHYKLGTPHVTYLISLVVAEFVQLDAKGPRGLPVQYFVPKGREEDAKRAFGNTPRMIEAYEKRVGVEYPYEKYAQTAVQDFIFGGMENTSSTTQTDLTLHDARAHIDFSSDPLVSHELAHQWFGDLLTCRDWSHGWLNEGFATFMERVWIENNPGAGGGLDEAKYYSYADLREYMDEDASRYRRPIVCNTYIEPIDLFDAHLYQKGGLVLNLLRHVLGEEPFWQCINAYVTRFREKNVETVDLIRTIEDVTGRNLRRFFDEWVFGTGYPEFSVTYAYIGDRTDDRAKAGLSPSGHHRNHGRRWQEDHPCGRARRST
jgi:aminopeptidase N